MSEIRLVQLSSDRRVEVFKKLGYNINEFGYIIDKFGKEVICKYSKERVHINTAAILPGSIRIINATPLTMAEYFMDLED